MTPVSHGKPCAGNPHARFDEGAPASEKPRRNALLHIAALQSGIKGIEYVRAFRATGLEEDAGKDWLWDVWRGKALNKLRVLKNKDFGSCASCVDRAWCKVCPMRNFNETGNMFTHAPWRCEATKIYRMIFGRSESC